MPPPRSIVNAEPKRRPRLTRAIFSYSELKSECQKLGITNTVIYKERYTGINGFPAHPERIYSNEWTSYKDFFDIKEFVSYSELTKIIHPLALKKAENYKKFIKTQNDPTLPFDPQTAYPREWINWYRFLGKEEPFRTEYISAKYSDWAARITEFMNTARGGATKVNRLCQFVRFYIEQNDLGTSPEKFLTQEKNDIKPLRALLDSFDTDNMRASLIKAVSEFLDFILNKYLTEEDDETGEIVRVMNAKNPVKLLLSDQSVTSPTRTETVKPCLPYHFVKKAQLWIIPSDCNNFSDLKHLQGFDADWAKIDPEKINKRDPDCVYRQIDNEFYIWVPTDWLHAYALTKVPLRGRQIAYNDSGEGDDYIAECDETKKIIWVKNTHPFAGMTKNQSFIKRLPDDGIGMFVTTNKTGNSGAGYSIPWMPEDLAYWLVRLRKWQQNYNPIDQPTSWIQNKRTNFNEEQLKAKGINCFLFRAYGDIEAKHASAALSPRLAAALHNIQPDGFKLASFTGNESTLKNYSSKFTPHSMRVSLITAYVVDMGMPIEIVMKIVGHSSVVMTIYYTKISDNNIRKKLEEGEKLALRGQAEATQTLIEQNKIDEIKNRLIGSNKEVIKALTNEMPAASYVFRDYGLCPYAAARCHDGGELIGSNTSNLRAPVPSGHLGIQNCLRCRHFVTGPAFLGGLLSISNEILLQSNSQSELCHSLQAKADVCESKLNQLDKEEYLSNLKGTPLQSSNRYELEAKQRRIEGDYESAAKKLDMLLCDLQASYGLIQRSQEVIRISNNSIEADDSSYSLIRRQQGDVSIELEETSYFQQLQEVCENATIYQSASAENAILPRTQILDQMTMFNDIAPSLFTMSKEDQLKAGNELFRLLKSRLKSWTRIEKVVNREIKLSELLGTEQITASDMQLIKKPALFITSRGHNEP